MKLCFVSPGQWSVDILRGKTGLAGGAEAQVAHLASAFAGLGHKVVLIYGDGNSGDTVSEIAGVKCVAAFPSWQRPTSVRVFWQALQQSEADLIYSRLPHDFLWLEGLYAKRSKHTTFVYAIANDKQCNPWLPFGTRRIRFIHRAIYALGMRMADVIAIQHEAQAQLVKPYITGRLVYIPNLVRIVKSQPRRYAATTIDAIWVSHIHPRKQLAKFLDIAAQLPEFQFVVVGGFGPEPNRSELEYKMQNLRNLRYEGPREFGDVIQLLITSKVLVNTSNWEGFPNTMLEAWSVGVPVVSLQIDPGGVIQRESIGLVSQLPSQMVRDIAKLVEDSSLNHMMGARGQEYVRRTHGLIDVCQGFERIKPGFIAQYDAVPESIR